MKPEKKKLTGDMPYKAEDIQKILRVVGKNLKFRRIAHILASTRIRIGAFSEIQLKHIQDMPKGCKSILVYDDDKAEYITFIHQEAVEALDEYLTDSTSLGEIMTPESWLTPSTSDSNKPALTVSIEPKWKDMYIIMMLNLRNVADMLFKIVMDLEKDLTKFSN